MDGCLLLDIGEGIPVVDAQVGQRCTDVDSALADVHPVQRAQEALSHRMAHVSAFDVTVRRDHGAVVYQHEGSRADRVGECLGQLDLVRRPACLLQRRVALPGGAGNAVDALKGAPQQEHDGPK